MGAKDDEKIQKEDFEIEEIEESEMDKVAGGTPPAKCSSTGCGGACSAGPPSG